MPSREAESAVEPEQRAADGATKHTGERDGDHEPSRRAGAHVRRKPLAQVVHDPWKKARFRNAEDEAEHVELDRCAHERHGDGDHAPREHDARDPPPRPHAREQQIARHLEQRVADEEDAGAEAERLGAEAEVAVHLERREPDVRAVEEVEDVEDEQERHEPPRDGAHRLALERGVAAVAGRADRVDRVAGA